MIPRRHTKDLYFVVPPAPTPGVVVIGGRVVHIPPHITRVYSLAAGPEYGTLVHEHESKGDPQ